MNSDLWIQKLRLKTHPEGGFYRETYRSEEVIWKDALPARFTGSRSYATSIYYLLRSGDFSSLHKIQSDEQWYFHAGTRLTIHIITHDGKYFSKNVGDDVENGDSLHICVPHGCWFGATVDTSDSFSLVSCVVAPGFDFSDFDLAQRDKLLTSFPQHKKIVQQLTR